MVYSEPAYYIIAVAGILTQDVLHILPNFYSGKLVWKNKNKNTYLEGWVKDQVALSGLLSYITDLHYILLSVNISNEPLTK